MINRVKITNLHDAESYSFNMNNRDYDIWISVVGNEDRRQVARMRKNFQQKNVKFFHQFFADWSDEDGIQWGHLQSEAPQLQHVQNIITFLKTFVEDDQPHQLGVNCFAGISRSTAIGIIALVMAGKTPNQALTEILKRRPEAWPNIRILSFASEILGIDIKNPVKEWKNSLYSIDEHIYIPNRMREGE